MFYERGREWFEVMGKTHFVMWWVPEGYRPTLDEALARLEANGIAYRLSRQPGTKVWQIFFNDPNGAKVELDFAPTERA